MKEAITKQLEHTFTVNGIDYNALVEIDLTVESWQENHGPGLREPMSETTFDFDFDATDPGGHTVWDKEIKRELRATIEEYINDNMERLTQ